MRRLKVAVLDLLSKGPTSSLWSRAMQPNWMSIMPQVVGVWCEQKGHDVTFVSYTGREDLARELPEDTDLVFIASYTQTAHLAYALANIYRKRGAVTALGGSHARCYPDDAAAYFDPQDPGALASAILGVLGSRSLELDLRARGSSQVDNFASRVSSA